MSLASEYAERVKAANLAPEPFKAIVSSNGRQERVAWVDEDGKYTSVSLILTPDKALELAAWIVKVFSEGKE